METKRPSTLNLKPALMTLLGAFGVDIARPETLRTGTVTFKKRSRARSGFGRRSRVRYKEYDLEVKYAKMSPFVTSRKCYVHPAIEAMAWELNALDASYRRPVCAECCEGME